LDWEKELMLTKLLQKGLRKVGLLEAKKDIPFGVYWPYDLKYFLQEKSLETVFDVGANVGQTAKLITQHFPDSTIYSFEPVPRTFDLLTERMKPFANVKPVNIAFGEQAGQAEILTTPLCETNTLLVNRRQKKASDTEEEMVTVNIDTVDRFCLQKDIQSINLLKVDTEGFEINVLKGAEKLLKEGKIDYILAECSFYQAENLDPHGDFVEILNYLHPFNYRVISFYTAAVNNFGWFWGDVLFQKVTTQVPGKLKFSPL
jgi:FkbM family methyltransferase